MRQPENMAVHSESQAALAVPSNVGRRFSSTLDQGHGPLKQAASFLPPSGLVGNVPEAWGPHAGAGVFRQGRHSLHATWTEVSRSIHIILAEDHAVVREGFRTILEEEPDLVVVGETGDGREAVDLVTSAVPDVLIVDLMMPGLNGLEVTRRVSEQAPGVKVIVLSMQDHEAYVLEALRRGASAYVLKNSGAGELKRALREVMAGRRYLGPPLSERAIEIYVGATSEDRTLLDPFATLTDREREVLQLTSEGCTSNETAERLSLSPRTVQKHRENIMKKLGVSNRAELVHYTAEHGLFGASPLPVSP